MKNVLEKTGNLVRSFIDFFYPPFKSYMSLQFFRYGITGASNLVFDWIMYFLIYNFVLQYRMLDLGLVVLSPHIATLAIKIPIVILSGFLLQKYVTFFNSGLPWGVQFGRYSIVFLVNLWISYIGLKILVDGLGFWPTPSNVTTSTVTVFISYYSQKLFTFKETDKSVEK